MLKTVPFTATADPTTDANSYVVTLKQRYIGSGSGDDEGKKSTSTLDINNDNLLWTFGGNYINGFTMYNVGLGKYAHQDAANSSVVTYVDEEDATHYVLRTNQDGFTMQILGNNIFINDRSNYFSTWNNSLAVSDDGSRMTFTTQTSYLIAKLIDFFRDKAGYVGGVPEGLDFDSGTGDLETAVRTAVNTPNVTNYEAALSAFEGYENKVQPVNGGYYRIISAYPGFANKMAIYHSSDNKFKWKTLDKENATFVFRFVQDGDKWKIYNVYSERYLKNNNGELTEDADEATSYTFVDQGLAVQNIYNGSGSGTEGSSGNIHANGHGNGANSSGTLIDYGAGAGGASAWYVVPVKNITDINMIEPNAVDEGETVHQSFAHSAEVLVVNGGVGVYKVTGVTDGKANMVSISSRVIPANTGVVLSGEKGKKVSLLTVSTDVGTDYGGNILEQGHNGEEDDSGNYVLAYKAEDTEAHFYKIGTLVIPTNRAYLPSTAVTSGVKALSLSFDDDEVTTGVEADEMKQPEDNAVVYDLQGRRVTRLQRGGLYIVGGKKVIVK